MRAYPHAAGHANPTLGTARVVTNSSGTVLDDCDFTPYGQEKPSCGGSGNTYKFTGKERDPIAEGGKDYFGARYFASNLARFYSVDPSGVSIDKFNPQSWNRYTYTLNHPLRFVDTNGKWPTDIHNQIIDRAFPGLSAWCV